MANGEWRMTNRKWGMGNGEWGMGNGEWVRRAGERRCDCRTWNSMGGEYDCAGSISQICIAPERRCGAADGNGGSGMGEIRWPSVGGDAGFWERLTFNRGRTRSGTENRRDFPQIQDSDAVTLAEGTRCGGCHWAQKQHGVSGRTVLPDPPCPRLTRAG